MGSTGGDEEGDSGDDSTGEEGQCVDDDMRDGVQMGDEYGDFCWEYVEHPNWCGNYDTEDFVSGQMCCACGGGIIDEGDEGEADEGDEGEADEGDEGDEGDEADADEGDEGDEADEGD